MKIVEAMHQGDVLFLKVENVDAESKQQMLPNDSGVILHVGEGIGHKHRVAPTQTDKLKVFFNGEQESVKEMLLQVKETVDVVHEEHGPLTLTPGNYIARTQRETFRGMRRAVQD